MALARLITRTPEYAQKLRQSLEAAGYAVEFAAPEQTFTTPADLQVDLDDPASASSYIVTADGREISFAYDEIEREFVLAPVWRKMKSMAAPVIERLGTRKANPPVITAERVEAAPAATFKPVEPVAKSIYLPEPPVMPPPPEAMHFTGEEYFDGRGARKNAAESVPVPPDPVPLPAPEAPLVPRTSLLVALAERAEALGTGLAEMLRRQRAIITAKPRKLRAYDAAWLRATPVASLIAVAFLLGWSFAGSERKPLEPKAAPPVELAGPNVQEAAIVPVAEPAPRKAAPATERKPAAAPKKKRSVHMEGEGDYADDVVIIRRHYPSKGVQAANQGGVRRYSDLD